MLHLRNFGLTVLVQDIGAVNQSVGHPLSQGGSHSRWIFFWRQLIYGPIGAITQLDNDNHDDDCEDATTHEIDLWEKFICCSWLSSVSATGLGQDAAADREPNVL